MPAEYPAGITLEVEMTTDHLALALKILAILELGSKPINLLAESV